MTIVLIKKKASINHAKKTDYFMQGGDIVTKVPLRTEFIEKNKF